MGRQIHAQGREFNRPEHKRFQGKKLETAVLKIKGSGREFTGLVPEDAGINKRIELIVKQNGGEIKKKYYAEMDAHEITQIRIGDQLITKNEEFGIHWGVEGGKIPIAVDNGQIRGFLNGDEVKSSEISVWSEKSTADPKSIEELQGNRRKVAGAHAATREKDPDLKKNQIILFDKETGELSPMQKPREAESFDYGEISMERIFVSEISAVRNNPVPAFESRNGKGMGERFYSYIEIIDAKESIADRVVVSNKAVEIPIPVASGAGAAQYASGTQPANETILVPEIETSQPVLIDYIAETPKPRYTHLPPPHEFSKEQAAKTEKQEAIAPAKLKTAKRKELKLFRYPPRVEKMRIVEAGLPEKYAPAREIVKNEAVMQKIKYEKPRAGEKGKKETPGKKRKRRRMLIRRAKEISVKIKMMKANAGKLAKEKKKTKKKSVYSEMKKLKPAKKKRKHIESKIKPKVKTKKQRKEMLLKTGNKKKKPVKKSFEKPRDKVKQKRNKRDYHKRLHQMLV